MCRQSLEKKRYTALKQWTETIESVHNAVIGKTSSGGRLDVLPSEIIRDDRW